MQQSEGALKSPRCFVTAIAIATTTFAAYLLIIRQQVYPTEIVEPSAIAMIELGEVPPDVLSFLKKLRSNPVVGHSTSEFPRLWQNALTNVEEEREDNIVWYKFVQPMTA